MLLPTHFALKSLNMNTRFNELTSWIREQFSRFELAPLPADASFRRYYRVTLPEISYIVMDAPPSTENCRPFVAISQALRELKLHSPEIIASDLAKGFLLLSDFGDELYLTALNEKNAEALYRRALDSLAILQACRNVREWNIPLFTEEFMRQELELFKEWFLRKHLNFQFQDSEKKLNTCFDFLANVSASQPRVFMHRDFHSANLMVLPEEKVGILDFQDAFFGPVTYDLVSLLRDCYISWPDSLVRKLVLDYQQKIALPTVSPDEFLRWFDLMGLQRHMKALLTFSRKWHRDQNANYLQHIPRTLAYIAAVSERYPECKIIHESSKEWVNLCAR